MRKVIGLLYSVFWYLTEVWLPYRLRRPYTYIILDWMHKNTEASFMFIPLLFMLLVLLGYISLIIPLFLIGLLSILMVHLILTHYVHNEQEHPEFNPFGGGENVRRKSKQRRIR